jgi:hypothetical protein
MRTRSILAAALAAAFPTAALASTVAPPADLGALARMSTAVVQARAGRSWVEEAGQSGHYTVTAFQRLRTVGGQAVPDTFTVREVGGTLGDRGLAVGGAPVYHDGSTYLLFLDRGPQGQWRARMMAYGLLVEDAARGLLVPVPEAGALDLFPTGAYEPVGAYRTDLLLDHLAEVLRGAPWSRERAGAAEAPAPEATPPAQCRFLAGSDQVPIRWFNYETNANVSSIKATTPGQTGIGDGGAGAVSQSVAAWTNHADSYIRYALAATTPRTLDCPTGQQQNAVWFDDPCAGIPDLTNCAGTLAFGGAYFSGTANYDGSPWHPAVATFVVVNNGVSCIGEVSFREMMAHELGHTQGFGHHLTTPAPNPTMSAFLKADGRGASIVGADRFCASFAYHTFLDVPYAHFAWRFVEAVENAGITSGCNAGNYCPDLAVTREQMAVFLLLAREGPSYVPPACTTAPFNDVPVSSPYCRWIRELSNRGVTAGCTAGNYCPTAAVTREQMAVFLLRTREGSAYTPPACTTATFTDVPCSSGFSRWVYELVRRGIASGCGGSNFCPTSPNTRAQMAVFLATTFALPLPN